MSTIDRYCYTDVYADGTVICREKNIPPRSIPKEELLKKRLLLVYHFAGQDHPYANANDDWLELRFEQGVSISDLQKIVNTPHLDSEAREYIQRCITQNKVESK